MNDDFAKDVANGCAVAVRVHPGAKKNGFRGTHAGTVKIALTAPPIDGKANNALIAFFAEALRLPRARIVLVAGVASRTKTILITGKSAAEVAAALSPVETC